MRTALALAILGLAASPFPALSQTCGTTSAGFDAWKQAYAADLQRAGIGQRGRAAFADTTYAQRTINADRGQRSFKLSLDEFMEKRGANVIVSQGRRMKAQNPAFYSSLERAYGVPAGVLIAIHGMETGFGRFMGDANVLSAVATLAYDCRRPDFFRPHLIAALELVDSGAISPGAVGAMHGELGHTQFLPGNVIKFGQDANRDGRVDLTNLSDAMASTANFLKQNGWRPGRGYQPGEPNFSAIEAWNAAGVYQKAIAIIAARIDG